MKKKLVATLLALVMAAGLLPVTAFAADSSAQAVTLSEQYLFAGRNRDDYTEESYWAAPVVTDLDGDGALEIINAAYSLVVMDAVTGAENWRVNAGKDRSSAYSNLGNGDMGMVFCDVKVLDIDRDGKKEIVVGYGNGTVSVLDDQGYFKPGWPRKPTDGSIYSLVVDDLDLDGRMEIIVGVGHEQPESVWIYRCDGALVDGWPQLEDNKNGTHHDGADKDEYRSKTAYSAGVYANGIVTGDLNGDGYPEIIVPTDSQYIDAYYFDGSLVQASDLYKDQFGTRMWGKIPLYEDYNEDITHKNEGWGMPDDLGSRTATYRAQMTNSGTAYTDLDGDGKAEIVVAAYIEDRTTYTTQGNNTATIDDTKFMTVFILNQDRTRYFNEALGFDWRVVPNELNSGIEPHLKKVDANDKSGGVHPVPVCYDLDGDGYQEIIFNSYDGMVHCFSLDKTEWSFRLPKTTDTIYEYATPVVCKDINGDGKPEIIFASWTDCEDIDKSTGAYAGSTGVNGALYILSSEGKLLTSMDLPNGYRNYEDRLDPTAGFSNGVKAAPTVEDIDGDGRYEILLNTRSYALCVYKVNPGAAAAATASFSDVPESQWYAAPVKWAVENGVTSGVGGGKFNPDGVLTHSEIITFLWKAAGKQAPSSYRTALNIDKNQWYAVAAYWAAAKDMIDETFQPSAYCSRAEVAVYIWKAFGSSGSPEYRFKDVSPEVLGYDSDEWKAINWIAYNGISNGAGNNLFNPDGTCMRSEIVTFLRRAYVPSTRLSV